MGAQILVTSPYPEMTNLILDVAKDLNVEIIVIEEILDNAARTVWEQVRNNGEIEVIISRGGTAEAIKEAVDLPVVIIEGTDFDILRALWEAKSENTRCIGYLAYKYYQIDYDFNLIEKILGIQVKQYLYTNRQHIIEQVEKAYHDGTEVLVGGGEYGVTLAQAYGMNGGLIHSSRRAVIEALQRAHAILAVVKKQKAHEEELKTIINSAYEGIIAFDRLNKVTLFNSVAQRIFELDLSRVKGITIDELANLTRTLDIFSKDSPAIDQIKKIGNSQFVVSKTMITLEEEVLGSVYVFQDVTKIQNMEQQIRKELYKKGLVAKFSVNDIVADSKAMREVLERAEKYGATDSTVLVTGESGTGKELLAQSLHQLSPRKNGPFVAVNCAALPENLLESELFGYEEGAFTGAKKGGKIGLFELAHCGTIFLDEIGTVPLNLQAHLLRVLQEKEVRRVGGDKIIPVDVRIIAATNEDLRQMVEEGKFRRDLFFRLNVLNLKIPSLRERKEDIPHLINYYLTVFNARFNKNIERFHPDLWKWFLQYSWPGNIRELENLIQRCVIIAEGTFVDSSYLETVLEEGYTAVFEKSESGRGLTASIERPGNNVIKIHPASLDDIEYEVIKQLESVVKSKAELARILGISRTTLWKKIKDKSSLPR
ncbi:MAG: sigma 54-interacting transcriptional regulator [Desulfitobacteriaceae bacterium]